MELSPRIMHMTHWQRCGGDEINRTFAGEWLTAGHFSAPPPAHVGRCVTDAEWRTELRRVILTATSVSPATRRPHGCCSLLLPAVEVPQKVMQVTWRAPSIGMCHFGMFPLRTGAKDALYITPLNSCSHPVILRTYIKIYCEQTSLLKCPWFTWCLKCRIVTCVLNLGHYSFRNVIYKIWLQTSEHSLWCSSPKTHDSLLISDLYITHMLLT